MRFADSNAFEDIKACLSAEQALDHFLPSAKHRRYLCPFHDDHSPSLSAHSGGIRCWSCGWKGDLFRFIQDYEGVSPGDALKIAADLANVTLPELSPDRSLKPTPLSPERFRAGNAKLHREILRLIKLSAADCWRAAFAMTRLPLGPFLEQTGFGLNDPIGWQVVEAGAAADRVAEILVMQM
ncbi:MAG: CHC2 zinc finger domain-containing protein, partial [candidate division NC10 bacterium]